MNSRSFFRLLFLSALLLWQSSSFVRPEATPAKPAVVQLAVIPTITTVPPAARPTLAWLVVCSDGLNVRSRPSADASKVDVLGRGERVQVLEMQGDWARVGAVGRWVRWKYLCSDG